MTEKEKTNETITLTLTRSELYNAISGLREILRGPHKIPNSTGELAVLCGATFEELDATLEKLFSAYSENSKLL